MSDLLERIKWLIAEKTTLDIRAAEDLTTAVVREIESTHRIINPEDITEDMVEASFGALPAHYSAPDPTRRPWHALKARRRFSAMVKASKKFLD